MDVSLSVYSASAIPLGNQAKAVYFPEKLSCFFFLFFFFLSIMSGVARVRKPKTNMFSHIGLIKQKWLLRT